MIKSNDNLIPDFLKKIRNKVEPELWKKLMKLFVHGEEYMAIDILCEEFVLNKIKLDADEKVFFQQVADKVEIDLKSYDGLDV